MMKGNGRRKEIKYESRCLQFFVLLVSWLSLTLSGVALGLRIYTFIDQREYDDLTSFSNPYYVKIDLHHIVLEFVETCLSFGLLHSIYKRNPGHLEFCLWLTLIVCFFRVGDNMIPVDSPFNDYVENWGSTPFIIGRVLVLTFGFFYNRRLTQCVLEESLPLI